MELGVGNGRILLEAAAAGQTVAGVDSSAGMLSLCRARAEAAGVLDRTLLLQSDFRDFSLPEPAALIALPYDAVVHLAEPSAKRECFERVHSQLRSGGRFVLDQSIYDPLAAQQQNQLARLAFTYIDPKTGLETLMWLVSTHDIANQRWQTLSWTEQIAPDGRMARRFLGKLDNGILKPEAMTGMLEQAGFEVEFCFGSFTTREPFSASSKCAIWIARRR